jgi:hypothetical protein
MNLNFRVAGLNPVFGERPRKASTDFYTSANN